MKSASAPVARQRAQVLLAVVALVIPSVALAHAVVYPRTSLPGAYERYVLRVPNERDVPTTRVELHFPADLRVVSFGDVAGWRLEVLTDSAQRITGAIWTGMLPKERFVDFPFIAVNPRDSARVTWPTIQTYADGEVVQWTDPDTTAKTPVSATTVAALTPPPLKVSRTSLYIAVAALFLALTALAVALRPRGT